MDTDTSSDRREWSAIYLPKKDTIIAKSGTSILKMFYHSQRDTVIRSSEVAYIFMTFTALEFSRLMAKIKNIVELSSIISIMRSQSTDL